MMGLYQKVKDELFNGLAILFPSYFNKPLIDFFNRLKKVHHNPMPPALEKRISQEDFHKMLEFFLSNPGKEELSKIATLTKGDAYRLDKRKTKLPRTLNVLCSPEGEFLLMLETKRKLKDNTKDESLVKVCGISKCGKPAWRIDFIDEYFNLVRRLKLQLAEFLQDLDEAKLEEALSHKYSPELVVQQLMGPLYHSYKEPQQLKISLYAKKGTPLDEFIKSGKYKLLSEIQKRKIIFQLFLLVKEFHDDNSVYQDLKCENIIVFEDEQGEFSIKLTDLVLVDKHNDKSKPALATLTYQSPEISYYHSQKASFWYKYFNRIAAQLTLGHQLQSHCSGDKEEYSAPHKANDMWALGITIFYLQFDHYPQNNEKDLQLIKENCLLQGLLEPDRNKRIDINTAISLFHNQNRDIPENRKHPRIV